MLENYENVTYTSYSRGMPRRAVHVIKWGRLFFLVTTNGNVCYRPLVSVTSGKCNFIENIPAYFTEWPLVHTTCHGHTMSPTFYCHCHFIVFCILFVCFPKSEVYEITSTVGYITESFSKGTLTFRIKYVATAVLQSIINPLPQQATAVTYIQQENHCHRSPTVVTLLSRCRTFIYPEGFRVIYV